MSNKFVHLHVHSEYSLLDGLSKVKTLLAHVKENGMDSVAITDHGVMYGMIEFYKKSKEVEVKPIIGMEAYTTDGDHRVKPERSKSKNYHLLLLAKNNEGYKNLMKLTSIAHLEGYYYKPRFDRETLKKYSKGLICTSSCPQGELPQALIDGKYDTAKEIAQWFIDVFGEDYYLEVQRHNYAEFAKNENPDEIKRVLSNMAEIEKTINEGVTKLSRSMGIPLVATNDAHYIKKEDATAQDALVCIATGKNVSDVKRLRFIDAPSYYLKTPEEMSELFSDLPDAIENTVKIAEKCDVEIKMGEWLFPKIDLPKGVTADEYLKKRAHDAMNEKIENITKEYGDRLEYELKVICDKGYAPYFLMYMDMADWASERNIPINIRGSVAGSLTTYVLGITTVDPLVYALPFERFLNPLRPSAPDIDMDISDDKRDDMIRYLVEKYGKDKVAQICTFGRMLARGSVRDVARVLGYPYAIGDRVSKSIPEGSQGFPMTIRRAIEESPELAKMYKDDADTKKIIDLALQIEGNARHISVHAAGVVVAPEDLINYTPLQKEPSGDKIITQYEMHACEDIGLVKLDVLGIRNLTILQQAIALVKQTENVEINILKIPLDNKKTFDMLSKGQTMGTFQLSGSGMTKYIVELKPERIEDIMAMIALYRPGPIANIPDYIARKKGKQKIEYYHPKMEKFLDKSFGILVYQDDLLFTALELAGYDWQEVDKLRKAVGKKIPEEMAKQHERFVRGCIEHADMTKERAEGLWDLFEPFQGYGFNKAHAASYGMVAYQTAYMKANYPVEFMCALLTAESNDTEKIASAITECKRMKIKVLPPNINESATGFMVVEDKSSLEGKAIRFGLNAIKNVGMAAIDAILEERQNLKFTTLTDFLMRVDNRKVNKRVLESLIKVGAMSSFGKRSLLLAKIEEIRSRVARSKNPVNQDGLFSNEEINKETLVSDNFDDGEIEEFTDEEIENLERSLLGFSLSAKPIEDILKDITRFATHKIQDVSGSSSTVFGNIRIAAVVSEVRTVVTKKSGQEMAFVKAKDETGTIDLVVFPKIYQTTRDFLMDNKAILVSGKLDSRDEETAILVDQITASVDGNINELEKLFINIPKETGEHDLKRLRDVLLSHPGSQSVVLVFNEKEKIDLPIKVSWDKELAHKITQIFNLADSLD